MSLIAELSQRTPPPLYAATLKQFPRDAIAEKVGISTVYCADILTGYKRPGKKLAQRFIALAAQVEAEMNQQGHTPNDSENKKPGITGR